MSPPKQALVVILNGYQPQHMADTDTRLIHKQANTQDLENVAQTTRGSIVNYLKAKQPLQVSWA